MSIYKNQPKGVRQKRVGEQIQRLLAKNLVSGKLYIPKIDKFFINISHVELSADLRHAKIFLSLPPDCDPKQTLEVFQLNSAAFGKLISKHTSLKYIPVLKFYEDTFQHKADYTESLFNTPLVRKDLYEKTDE